MNITSFIGCLSLEEKREIFNELKLIFMPETLESFLTRKIYNGPELVSIRLTNAFLYAKQKKETGNPVYNFLDNPISSIEQKDFKNCRGFGPGCWKEFVSLRGY